MRPVAAVDPKVIAREAIRKTLAAPWSYDEERVESHETQARAGIKMHADFAAKEQAAALKQLKARADAKRQAEAAFWADRS